jgi:RluA family pseudouridine synthase
MSLKPANLLLYSDDDLLVVNKPAGLPTLPDGYDPDAPHIRSVFEAEFGSLWIVHRLDRETSGALLMARSAEAHRNLNTQFETRQVRKIYHALVEGQPDWQETVVKFPLRPDGDRAHRTIVDPQQGKPSLTRFRVLERFKSHTLVEALPETGRTHQIRVHLAALGFAIVVDPLYGDDEPLFLSRFKADYRPGKGEERPLLKRLGLHARSFELSHPRTEEQLAFEAPYSKDFGAALTQLRKFPA